MLDLRSAPSDPFLVDGILVDPQRGAVTRQGQVVRVEPKVMDALLILVEANGQTVSRDALEAALWPDTIVGEDTLARTMSKLRRAFGDTAKQAAFIETIPKRGYRLAAAVSLPGAEDPPAGLPVSTSRRGGRYAAIAALLFGLLGFGLWVGVSAGSNPVEPTQASLTTARADDYYMQFTRAGNEAAIELYSRVIADYPDYAPAQAGLSNALVQRVVRWSRTDIDGHTTTLASALASGRTQTAEAQAVLQRSVAMAEQAVRLAPSDAASLKALGFSYSAQGRLGEAERAYEQALLYDPDAWDVLINLGELASIREDSAAALAWLEQAFDAMDRAYESEPQRIGPWQSELGINIAETYDGLGRVVEAEAWYRKVIDRVPLHPDATVGLADTLRRTGRKGEAELLCRELSQRLDPERGCALVD